LGLTPAGLDLLRQDILSESQDLEVVSQSSLQASIADVRASIAGAIADLATFDGGVVSALTTLQQDPLVADEYPHAAAGGPYQATEGQPIQLDATASTGLLPIDQYLWDLNGDGFFDDATGQQPTVTFDAPGERLIGLAAVDSVGRFDL